MEAIPLVISWVSCLYTPFALFLYAFNKKHPSIRYRQPNAIAIVGGCLMGCSLLLPILIVSSARCIFFLLWFTFLFIATITYLLVQITLVVMFKSTEMLAHPHLATPSYASKMMRYRWYFNPYLQDAFFVVTHVVFILPIYYPFDGNALLHKYRGNCFDQVTWYILLGELGIIGVIALIVAFQVSHVVDNFGLRESAFSSAKCGVLIVLLGVFFSVANDVFKWDWIDQYYVHECIACLPTHVIFYFNILKPLRPVVFPKLFRQFVVVLPSERHERRDSIALSNFTSFLRHPDGYRAYLEFCRKELRLETLLAWHQIEEFKRGPTLPGAIRVFQDCMTPRCMYSTAQGKTWRPHYLK